ncbi:thioredoxin family protein [Aeoliella sp.]|uniref:thioredoxin family protein n=1 Tax=Aeoliella sp. TaxID=2795800 RepID=UPI003CCBAEFF
MLIVAIVSLALELGCLQEYEGAASDDIVDVTDANFQQEVLQVNEPVLVEFWAPWCQPCREMEPAIELIAQAFSGRVKVAKMRIDENPGTVAAYKVDSPPAVIVFCNGKVYKRRLGRQDAEGLKALLSDLLTGE